MTLMSFEGISRHLSDDSKRQHTRASDVFSSLASTVDLALIDEQIEGFQQMLFDCKDFFIFTLCHKNRVRLICNYYLQQIPNDEMAREWLTTLYEQKMCENQRK